MTQGWAKTAHHERVVEVSNLVEEVDLIFPGEQRRANTVHRRVPPSLIKEMCHSRVLKKSAPLPHFIVEATLLIQKLHKLGVRFTSPEVEIANLKVTPN